MVLIAGEHAGVMAARSIRGMPHELADAQGVEHPHNAPVVRTHRQVHPVAILPTPERPQFSCLSDPWLMSTLDPINKK